MRSGLRRVPAPRGRVYRAADGEAPASTLDGVVRLTGPGV